MSAFGTSQANRDIWERDAEAERLQNRIRDMLLVIALDSLCLSEIVPTADGAEPSKGSLLRSRDKIIALQLFLLDQSEQLAQADDIPEYEGFPDTPMPIICLAWAIVLGGLPQNMIPPTPGFDIPMYQEFANRALGRQSGLFPWLQKVLEGPLFEPGDDVIVGDAPGEGATNMRVVIKGKRNYGVYRCIG